MNRSNHFSRSFAFEDSPNEGAKYKNVIGFEKISFATKMSSVDG